MGERVGARQCTVLQGAAHACAFGTWTLLVLIPCLRADGTEVAANCLLFARHPL